MTYQNRPKLPRAEMTQTKNDPGPKRLRGHLHLHLYVEPSRFDFYSTGLTSSGNAGKMEIKENKVR